MLSIAVVSFAIVTTLCDSSIMTDEYKTEIAERARKMKGNEIDLALEI